MVIIGIIAAVTICSANAVNRAFHKAPVDADISNNHSNQLVEPIPQQKSGFTGFKAFLVPIIWGFLIYSFIYANSSSKNSTDADSSRKTTKSELYNEFNQYFDGRDTGSLGPASKCTNEALSASELEKLKLTTINNSYELYNGNEFPVLNVKTRFHVKNREYPIERQISADCKNYCSLNDLAFHWFRPKDYTEANGIPENTMSYTVLSATRRDCQQ